MTVLRAVIATASILSPSVAVRASQAPSLATQSVTEMDGTAKAGQDLSPDASTDDIFQQVFGSRRPALSTGDYAVQIEGIYIGDFAIKPGEAGKGSMNASFVRNTLAPLLVAELRTRVATLADEGEFVDFEHLRAAGLEVEFDNAQLLLRIGIPAQMREVSNLYLRTVRQRGDIDYVKQSKVSAYVSTRTGLTFIEDAPGSREGLYRTVTDINAAVNIHGLVTEAEFRFDSRLAKKFRRGDVRLTYDDRSSLIRYELGDLSVGKRPFQIAPRIAGLSAYREYAINPYFKIRPSAEQQFLLEQSARVEVFVNGVPSRTYNLSSGRYNLRDFPLVSSAANDIELLITYASGQTERLSFPAFFDIDLLSPGLLDFAVNLGVPFRDNNGIRDYNTSNYNASGYLRYGLSKTVTLGMNWESDRYFSNFGGEFLWATSIGTFAVNGAMNIRDMGAKSGRLSVQYRWREADKERDRAIDGFVTLSGKDYRTLNSIMGTSLVAMESRVRLSQKAGQQGRAQIFATYNRYRGRGKSYGVGAGYLHQFGAASLSGNAEYRRSSGKSEFLVNLGIVIPFGRSSMTAAYDSNDNGVRVAYNLPGSDSINSMSFSAAVERRDGADRQLGRVNYVGNRFEASFEQMASNYFSQRAARELRSDFTFGAALVMADGHLALSRPVSDSFAIFDPDPAAGDYPLMVEPRVGFGSADVSYSAQSGDLGPAVVTSLAPYFNRPIRVEAPDAPAGSSLTGQTFSLNPGYRSGHYLKVGSAGNVSVVGNLVDRDGDPLAYVTGQASRPVAAKDASPMTDKAISLFTNAAGRFFFDGAEAGNNYAIEVEVNGEKVSAMVEVPETAEGLFRISKPVSMEIDVPPQPQGDRDE